MCDDTSDPPDHTNVHCKIFPTRNSSDFFGVLLCLLLYVLRFIHAKISLNFINLIDPLITFRILNIIISCILILMVLLKGVETYCNISCQS